VDVENHDQMSVVVVVVFLIENYSF
ncbi:MAG: hypothetical protein ACI90V_012574, partial [Bacillariaceae sp.]